MVLQADFWWGLLLDVSVKHENTRYNTDAVADVIVHFIDGTIGRMTWNRESDTFWYVTITEREEKNATF